MIRHLELTLDRRSRFKLLFDAMQAGSKAGSNGQLRVGVGTGQAVFHPPRHRRAGRDTKTGSAIVL